MGVVKVGPLKGIRGNGEWEMGNEEGGMGKICLVPYSLLSTPNSFAKVTHC
ncbi:hypothetical protein NSTC731_01679 [Nostoc sp. DSM 114167]|jgi:hypothetical protein